MQRNIIIAFGLLAIAAAPSEYTAHTVTVGAGNMTLPAYTRSVTVAASAAVLGPTAPSFGENASAAGLLLAIDAESVHVDMELADCWAGGSGDDVTLKIYWTNEEEDALADGETVKFDIAYRSIVWGTEGVDNGSEASATVTYTQSGAGADGDTHESELTIPATGGNQPLAMNDTIMVHLDRDVSTDTYSGAALVERFEFDYSATSVCDHD